MKSRLIKTLRNIAANLLLFSAFIVTFVHAAQAETLLLFLSPAVTVQPLPVSSTGILKQNKLMLDEKGDLLIQIGSTRFTVAYNEPIDQFKPSEQQYPQRERTVAINGISITASLTF